MARQTNSGEEQGYNGWRNYETWCVHLWLTNDQGTQEHWREQARECWEEAQDSQGVLTPYEAARVALSTRLRDEVEEGAPTEPHGLYTDLLGAALAEVSWAEIAKAFLEGVAEEQ